MKIQETVINIIFDPARGNLSTLSREGVVGRPIGELPRPSRRGYSFVGWFDGDTPVTPETQIGHEEDFTLTAHWEKSLEKKPLTLFQKQKIAVVILAVAVVALAITLVVVNNIVAIYGLTDTYYNEAGELCTDHYKIKKNDGVYVLCDSKGKPTEPNDDGYYIAEKSGNQYSIDPDTGESEIYATVDYDSENGESLGYRNRIMLFPQISQTNTFSVKVTNEYGTYELYRDSTGAVQVKGFEDKLVSYDKTLYANLCVSCGYTLTMQKINLADADHLDNGEVDYSAFGLAEVGEYKPARYTITAAKYADDGTCSASDTSYTVLVGDAILSGAGYYIKRADKPGVYIISSDIAKTVLQPVETMVTPMIVYPMAMATYSMVQNFLLAKMDCSPVDWNAADLDAEMDKITMEPVTAFSYQDLAERENTMYSSTPYITAGNIMKGYSLNSDNVSTVLYNLYSMQFLSVKKLGITKEALHEYGLDGKVTYLSYLYDVTDATKNGTGTPEYIENMILVGEKTADGTYYAASFLCDMIVEVDQYYFDFVEWNQDSWYYKYFFQSNISFIEKLDLICGSKQYHFTLDNSATDQSEGVSSSDLKVYCQEYTGSDVNAPHLLDYTIQRTYTTDAGKEKVETIAAVDNFRQLYKGLLWYSIEGVADEEVFKNNLGKTINEYIAQGDENCLGKIVYHAEDMASVLNTSKDGDGNPLYSENNVRDIVIRFYQYTDQKALLTVEVIQNYDGDGNPISDPTAAEGRFYVLTSYLDKLMNDAAKVVAGERVVTDSKN